MAKSSKGKMGRPATGVGTLVGVRVHADLLARVDRWRGKQAVPPTRPQAIIRLTEIGLTADKPSR